MNEAEAARDARADQVWRRAETMAPLTYLAQGRAREAAGRLLATLTSHLSRYRRPMMREAAQLVQRTLRTQPGVSGRWLDRGALIARWIFVAIFGMALFFKLHGIAAIAEFIGSAGFPAPLLLTWLAVVFESLLVFCLATGFRFRLAALTAGAYVIFLGFAFHGPSKWSTNQMEFGFFIDHFTFLAGLLYAAAYGPGERRHKGRTAETQQA